MHYISIRLCLVLGRNREHSHNPFFPQPILRRPWTFFFPSLFIPLPNHVFGMFFLAVLSLLLIPLLKLPVYQKSVFICHPLFARFPPNLSFLLVLKLKRIVSSSVSFPFSIPTFPFLSLGRSLLHVYFLSVVFSNSQISRTSSRIYIILSSSLYFRPSMWS